MKPVTQTIVDDGRGNCYAACIASLLDLPIDAVPNFVEAEDMHQAAWKWLAERGLRPVRMCFPSLEALQSTYFDHPGLYCVLSGESPRRKADGGKKWHAVVGFAAGYGVEVVHDPHPDRTGLVGDAHRWLTFIVPTG